MNRQAALLLPVVLMACATGSIRGVWQTCGVYDWPLYNENAVHSLEHGVVWILYRQGIAVDQIQQLQEAAAGQPFTLLSSYPDLRSPLVRVAWNTQLDLDSTTDPRIERFIQRYARGSGAPEPGATCSGGSRQTS